MKNHRVEFVGETDLPAGVDWLMTRCGEAHTLFVRDTAPLCQVLSEAWVAFHRQMVVPEPRGTEPQSVELKPLREGFNGHTFAIGVG